MVQTRSLYISAHSTTLLDDICYADIYSTYTVYEPIYSNFISVYFGENNI